MPPQSTGSFEKALRIAQRARFIKKNIVCEPSSSISYLTYRVARPVLKLYDKVLKRGQNDIPWLAPAAIKILDHLLTKEMTGLEYGSGRSSLFFAKRIGKLVSVEHFEPWHKIVNELIERTGVTNIDYHLIRGNTDIAKPNEQKYLENSFDNRAFPDVDKYKLLKEYITFIDGFADHTFDFILVDGRARELILPKAIDKLKSGGILVLDNAERARYEEAKRMIDHWPTVNTSTGLTDTTFWFKP